MLDPLTAAPVSAQHATAHAPEWVTATAARTYETQAEANAGSIASNLAGAAATIREIAANPDLLGNRQVTEELDNRLDYLHGVAEILAGRGVDRRAKLNVEMGMGGAFGSDERAALDLIADVADPLDLAAQVAQLRAALDVLGPRPEPEVDPETVAMLEWIRAEVAPRRDAESLLPLEMPHTGSLLGDIATIAALDESGDEGIVPELADWVPAAFVPEVTADA